MGCCFIIYKGGFTSLGIERWGFVLLYTTVVVTASFSKDGVLFHNIQRWFYQPHYRKMGFCFHIYKKCFYQPRYRKMRVCFIIYNSGCHSLVFERWGVGSKYTKEPLTASVSKHGILFSLCTNVPLTASLSKDGICFHNIQT